MLKKNKEEILKKKKNVPPFFFLFFSCNVFLLFYCIFFVYFAKALPLFIYSIGDTMGNIQIKHVLQRGEGIRHFEEGGKGLVVFLILGGHREIVSCENRIS